jgi:hypothetical protein
MLRPDCIRELSLLLAAATRHVCGLLLRAHAALNSSLVLPENELARHPEVLNWLLTSYMALCYG